MSDDGLECDDGLEITKMQVATCARLAERGIDWHHPFAFVLVRRDGQEFEVASSLANLRAMHENLCPPVLNLSVALHEDHDAMLAAILLGHSSGCGFALQH